MAASTKASETLDTATFDVRPPELDPDLSPAMQRCLMAIVAARREAAITATEVARELGCSTPTSLEMLRRLGAAGLLERDPRRRGNWQLTAHGRHDVAALRRRQNVLERFLRTTLHLDAEEAAREAELLGPSVSSLLESRLRDAVWPSTRPCREPTA